MRGEFLDRQMKKPAYCDDNDEPDDGHQRKGKRTVQEVGYDGRVVFVDMQQVNLHADASQEDKRYRQELCFPDDCADCFQQRNQKKETGIPADTQAQDQVPVLQGETPEEQGYAGHGHDAGGDNPELPLLGKLLEGPEAQHHHGDSLVGHIQVLEQSETMEQQAGQDGDTHPDQQLPPAHPEQQRRKDIEKEQGRYVPLIIQPAQPPAQSGVPLDPFPERMRAMCTDLQTYEVHYKKDSQPGGKDTHCPPLVESRHVGILGQGGATAEARNQEEDINPHPSGSDNGMQSRN